MARRERRYLAQSLDLHNQGWMTGPPKPGSLPFESLAKCYCLSRQQEESPRFQADNATILLWMELDSPKDDSAQHERAKAHWSSFAETYFEKTLARRLFILDFTLLSDQVRPRDSQ